MTQMNRRKFLKSASMITAMALAWPASGMAQTVSGITENYALRSIKIIGASSDVTLKGDYGMVLELQPAGENFPEGVRPARLWLAAKTAAFYNGNHYNQPGLSFGDLTFTKVRAAEPSDQAIVANSNTPTLTSISGAMIPSITESKTDRLFTVIPAAGLTSPPPYTINKITFSGVNVPVYMPSEGDVSQQQAVLDKLRSVSGMTMVLPIPETQGVILVDPATGGPLVSTHQTYLGSLSDYNERNWKNSQLRP